MIKLPITSAKLQQHVEQAGIIGGYPLGEHYSGMDNCMLFCVTETHTKEDIDTLVATLREVALSPVKEVAEVKA